MFVQQEVKIKRIKMPATGPSKAALATILNHEEPDEKMGVKEPFREPSKLAETKYILCAFYSLTLTENDTAIASDSVREWSYSPSSIAEQLASTTLLAAHVTP